MAKARPRVSTISQAVKAYGGPEKFDRAFGLTNAATAQGEGPDRSLEVWHRAGVPPRYLFGLYVGLERRGYEPTPKLFGLKSWCQLECEP
jgi:hypothetical protein